jgi:flagellar motility protein MotE (MotC chaperone)
MTRAGDKAGRPDRDGNGARILLCLVALGLLAGFGTPASAQQGWVPTVATAPGGSFHTPADANGRLTTNIDPRYFPSRNTPPPSNPLPQGAWSPIVTGGIPEQSIPTEPKSIGAPAAAAAPTTGRLSPLEPLTPIRPVAPRAVVAASEAPGSGATQASPPAKAQPSASQAAAGDGDTLFKKPGPLDMPPPNATAAQQYCFNTADSAADARFAWQARKIKEMEAELDKRAQQLEAKTEEYKQWLQRRDEFSRKAHEKLVGFYSRMRPDAAALQLATLDEEMAAAVVTKLETKVASQIMGEMDPERAAKIATIISGAAKIPPERRRASGQSEGASGAQSGPPDGATQPEQPRS